MIARIPPRSQIVIDRTYRTKRRLPLFWWAAVAGGAAYLAGGWIW